MESAALGREGSGGPEGQVRSGEPKRAPDTNSADFPEEERGPRPILTQPPWAGTVVKDVHSNFCTGPGAQWALYLGLLSSALWASLGRMWLNSPPALACYCFHWVRLSAEECTPATQGLNSPGNAALLWGCHRPWGRWRWGR